MNGREIRENSKTRQERKKEDFDAISEMAQGCSCNNTTTYLVRNRNDKKMRKKTWNEEAKMK